MGTQSSSFCNLVPGGEWEEPGGPFQGGSRAVFVLSDYTLEAHSITSAELGCERDLPVTPGDCREAASSTPTRFCSPLLLGAKWGCLLWFPSLMPELSRGKLRQIKNLKEFIWAKKISSDWAVPNRKWLGMLFQLDLERRQKLSKKMIVSSLKPTWLFVIGCPQCFDFVTLKHLQA